MIRFSKRRGGRAERFASLEPVSDPRPAVRPRPAGLGALTEPVQLPVLTVQQQLRRAGYNVGRIDGRWGPTTENAFKRFLTRIGYARGEQLPLEVDYAHQRVSIEVRVWNSLTSVPAGAGGEPTSSGSGSSRSGSRSSSGGSGSGSSSGSGARAHAPAAAAGPARRGARRRRRTTRGAARPTRAARGGRARGSGAPWRSRPGPGWSGSRPASPSRRTRTTSSRTRSCCPRSEGGGARWRSGSRRSDASRAAGSSRTRTTGPGAVPTAWRCTSRR